ncbi:MAG TPA: hypothetical protein VMB71_10660 [Acetobacteraceae bacterium]|nr:hypothetical protein [Acetobacteraceae bacterium]
MHKIPWWQGKPKVWGPNMEDRLKRGVKDAANHGGPKVSEPAKYPTQPTDCDFGITKFVVPKVEDHCKNITFPKNQLGNPPYTLTGQI